MHRVVGDAETAQRGLADGQQHGVHLPASGSPGAVAVGVLLVVHRDVRGLEHLAALPRGIEDQLPLLLGGLGEVALAGVAEITGRQDEGDVALEPCVHVADKVQLVLCALEGSLEAVAEDARKGCCGPADGHIHADMGADHLIHIPVSAAALKTERDLVRRALHGLHDLHRVGVVAHKDEVLALILLEDGQHIGQLPGLHRHKNEVVAVVRGQRVDGRHPVHRGAALRPVADHKAPLVEPFLPLTPRQHGDDVLLVLQQTVGQFTALHPCTIDQYPHLCLPPFAGPLPGPEVLSASKTRRNPFSRRAFPPRQSPCSRWLRWQPSGLRCPAAGPRR